MAIPTAELEIPEPPEDEVVRGPTLRQVGPAAWAKANLFNSVLNTILTVVFSALILYVAYRGLRFVFVTGRWEIVRLNMTNYLIGTFPRGRVDRLWMAFHVASALAGLGAGVRAKRAAMRAEADGRAITTADRLAALRAAAPALIGLVVILVLARSPNGTLLVLTAGVGFAAANLLGRRLPVRAHRWLPLVYMAGIVATFAFMTQPGRPGPYLLRVAQAIGWGAGLVVLLRVARTAVLPRAGRWTPLVYLAGAAATAFALSRIVPLLFADANTNVFGGALLNVYLAAGGIILCFPLGLLLALGRRSSFPAVRIVCVGFIELIRGVPLISLLFIGFVAIGFLLPVGSSPPSQVLRAMVAFTLFAAAYVAEIVRGGLQSVPKGQAEAAVALGLGPITTLRTIVLPQALRNVIPALVGQFISLFKDTSLVFIIGLAEILRVSRNVLQQPDFLGQGLQAESMAFAAFFFWVCCYSMSRASQRLEKRLGVGVR